MDTFILALNGGSSSLKFALFRDGAPPGRVLAGRFERIGLPDPVLVVADQTSGADTRRVVAAPDHAACVGPLLEAVATRTPVERLAAVGHRIVHGGPNHIRPERITPAMLAELRRIGPFDPEHLPAEIGLIEALERRLPGLPQVACFDTAFHADLPRVARLLPIPRRYEAMGIRRYGFHGLSYAFLMEELTRIEGARGAGARPTPGAGAARGRVVLAHLGNGASMAAVREGRPIDTTMAFTPAAGLPMSRRSGDLDPGLVAYLARAEGMTPERFNTLVNSESGLLGVSETSPDVRDLLAREATDPRAAEALALFCYQARKGIGAFAAALGGLDTLVFSGGIGENAPAIRERICDGLGFLGIAIDPRRNAAGAPVISLDGGAVTVRVIRTDEEMQIARAVAAVLGNS